LSIWIVYKENPESFGWVLYPKAKRVIAELISISMQLINVALLGPDQPVRVVGVMDFSPFLSINFTTSIKYSYSCELAKLMQCESQIGDELLSPTV
jgi:hypothetical protein